MIVLRYNCTMGETPNSIETVPTESSSEVLNENPDYNAMREELITLQASERYLESRVNSNEARRTLALNLAVQTILENDWNLDWSDKAEDVFSENQDGETVFDLNWNCSDVSALTEQNWADAGLTSQEGLSILRSEATTIQVAVQDLEQAATLKDQAESVTLKQSQLNQVQARIAVLEPKLRLEASTDYTWLAEKFESTQIERQQRYEAAGLRDFDIKSIEESIATVIRPNTLINDADYAEDHLTASVTEKGLTTYEAIMREVFGFQDYPLPQVSELTPEKIAEYDNVELVVHPLFSMLATDGVAYSGRLTTEEWEASGKSVEGYIEGKMVDLTNIIQEQLEQNPSQMPLEYAILLEIYEEYQKVNQIPPNTLRIYVNSSPFELKPERQQAYHQLFQSQAENGNAYQIYSESQAHGYLRESDRAALEMVAANLKDTATVTASGAYLEACLEMAYDTEESKRLFSGEERPNFERLFGSRLNLDYHSSTPASVITSNYRYVDEETGESIEMQDGIALRELSQGLPPINIPNNLTNLHDVFAYVEANQSFNTEWKNRLQDDFTNNRYWES